MEPIWNRSEFIYLDDRNSTVFPIHHWVVWIFGQGICSFKKNSRFYGLDK